MVRDLAQLPKAHLHLHLEGAMRPSTLADLASAAGVAVPPVRGYTSFSEFELRYRAASALIVTKHDLRRVVREVVDEAADDGAVWVEPHFYPPRYVGEFGSADEVLEIVLDEGRRAADRRGIGCGWIVSALRGLAADEALFPPDPFAGRSGSPATPG